MPVAENSPIIPVARVLDVSGLSCPLPLLKAKLALAEMQSGEVLQVFATDPLAPLDFQAFCLRTAHEMIRLVETEARSEFFIRKA